MPPHAAHLAVAGLHAKPEAVQKFAATPTPPVPSPRQHASPEPPQTGVVLQLPVAVAQVPKPVPHVAPLARQVPSTQQRPPAHVLSWQHGSPAAAPQVVGVPLTHTCVPLVFSPLP